MLTFVQFGFTHVIYVEMMNLVLGSILGWFINSIGRLCSAKDSKFFTKFISKIASFIQTFFESFMPYWTQPGGNNDAILKSCWTFVDWIIIIFLAVKSHEYIVKGEYVESDLMGNFIFKFAREVAHKFGIIDDIHKFQHYDNYA